MATSEEKFRKLLAAYEDEVQRKQHKMGKKVDPRDEAQPNASSGYCTFLRGQQVVWSPSFDVIGTFEPATGRWTWGWADQTLDPKVRTRIDAVRKQAIDWKIECLTSGLLTLGNEQEAWELSTVATAVSRADGMYRLVEGPRTRFLALFDGPPPSRSASMRAVSPSSFPGANARPQTPYPGTARTSPPSTSAPALQRTPTNPTSPALQRTPTPPPAVAKAPSAYPQASEEREPTLQTRAELGMRMAEVLTAVQQTQLGALNLLARATPPSGPVGAVGLDLRLTLRPGSGPDLVLTPSAALHEALAALWLRCRDHQGGTFRFATVRLERGLQGLETTVHLEW